MLFLQLISQMCNITQIAFILAIWVLNLYEVVEVLPIPVTILTKNCCKQMWNMCHRNVFSKVIELLSNLIRAKISTEEPVLYVGRCF